MILDAINIPGRIINAIKGEKADWNQINHSNHSNHSKSFQIIPNHSKSFQIIPNQLTIKAIWAIENSAFSPLNAINYCCEKLNIYDRNLEDEE